ncbi:hypothetical protein ACQ4PT_018515 [Festuca glaucescens]
MASSGSHRSTDNIPTDDDSGHGPAPTSRTSVHKVYAIISNLCDFKKFLVEQIGFGGILKLPNLARLNLRFSKWVMSKIDTENRCFHIDSNKTIRFWVADVHKVFGVPCGNRDIHARDAVSSNTSVQIIKSPLGMSDKGKPILKAAEEILSRPLSESTSSNIEKDSFKMAFVIFVMGHLLTPSSKHEHTVIDFWGAIANTDSISDFNWCEYVLQDLFRAVAKLNLDVQKDRTNTHLQGCHLFAQVFYLDNMNLGIFNMRHDVLPQISCFDDVKMRRMILQCSTPLKGVEDWSAAMVWDPEQICYTRSMWDTKADTMTPGLTAIHRPQPQVQRISPAAPCTSQPLQHTPAVSGPDTLQLSNRVATANDFSNHMKEKYPLLAFSEVGLMLKHHNAVGFQIANAMKNHIDQENTRFLDKFVAVMAETCICCSLRSLPCIAQNKCGTADKNAMYETPKNLLPCHARSPADSMKTWADTILGGIMMYNEDTEVPIDVVVMGQTCAQTPDKPDLRHTHYTKDHWRAGTGVEYPSIAVQDKLGVLITRMAPFYHERNCITHPTPRYISMPASTLIGQLLGNDFMEHDLCSLAFRRLRQLDMRVLYKEEDGVYRHLFEVDFSVSKLHTQHRCIFTELTCFPFFLNSLIFMAYSDKCTCW